ncbi:MAG: hypothetical protein LBS85_03405 [Clostridiales Family XIII bacterium]|jgi:hypothetical protein|nr:hypothetical protein [Clostridiales Family XIII bacterium]
MDIVKLTSLHGFDILDDSGRVFRGGDQHWYTSGGFIKEAACGATTCSNIMSYLLRTRTEIAAGYAETGRLGEKGAFVRFMEMVYPFVHPRAGGLMADYFVSGTQELARSLGISARITRHQVPVRRSGRPGAREAGAFLCESLKQDIPAAFLILSNGSVPKLDTWHWVTITAVEPDTLRAQILDNGQLFWADLARWLETSLIGGSFVCLSDVKPV